MDTHFLGVIVSAPVSVASPKAPRMPDFQGQISCKKVRPYSTETSDASLDRWRLSFRRSDFSRSPLQALSSATSEPIGVLGIDAPKEGHHRVEKLVQVVVVLPQLHRQAVEALLRGLGVMSTAEEQHRKFRDKARELGADRPPLSERHAATSFFGSSCPALCPASLRLL